MSPKTSFTIAYKKPGISPPVFLAGSFSDPQWELQEMEYVKDQDGEFAFQSKVAVEVGKDYQFKLRVGHGDWWVLAENYPVATDDAGNQNNLLNVPEPSIEEQISPAGVNTPAINVKHDVGSVSTTSQQAGNKDETEDIKMPLFAHECLGAYDFGDGDSDHEAVPEASSSPDRNSKHRSRESDEAEIDVNDPTLEKFPSDRGSIMDALRTIQTHLDEDHTHLDDIPLSPRVVSSRRTSLDSADELSLSPAPLSPTATRRRESRLSHSSFGRTRSAVSLGSIAEEPKPSGEKKPQSPPVVSLPNPNTKMASGGVKSPPSEEDEAVVMKAPEVKPNEKTDTVSSSQVESYEAQKDHPDTGSGTALNGDSSPVPDALETNDHINGTSSTGEAVEDKTSTSDKPISVSLSQDRPSISASESKKPLKDKSAPGDPSQKPRGSVLPMIVTTGALAVAIGIGWWRTTNQ